MSSGAARYDGHAEWYDQTFSAHPPSDELAFLRRALGSGDGQVCLDLACGTGRVGFHHKTLESFLGAILESGLTIRALREFSGGGVIVPRNIGLVAEK